MPVVDCEKNGRPGKKCGKQGKCYTYGPGGDVSSKGAAFRKACAQCRAMGEPCVAASKFVDQDRRVIPWQQI